MDWGSGQRRLGGELQWGAGFPIEVDFAFVAEIPVEGHCQTGAKVAAQQDFFPAGLNFKHIAAAVLRHEFTHK